MKLETVKKIVYIEIEIEELVKYQKAFKNIIDIVKPDGWTNDLGELRNFHQKITSIINDARSY